MKSRDYFEAFCRALENAQIPEPGAQVQLADRDIFLRVKDILQVCYEGNPDQKFCNALQRRAGEIMLEVSDPKEWQGALDVYGAAWRLSNVLPDDEDAKSALPPPDESAQTLKQDLLLMVGDLEHLTDQLDSELDIQLVVLGETDARIVDLQNQLERLRKPFSQIKDIAGSGVKYSDFFGAGSAGVRFIDGISDPIVAVSLGSHDLALSPEARDLVRNAATGARDLACRIAGAVAGNADLSRCADKCVERIERYLVAESLESKQRGFRDVSESWCPEMVDIPPGAFLMGSADPAHQDEIPQHPVKIGYGFAVGRYPVTFEEYDAFCRAARRQKPGDNGWGRERRPVINVSWDDAQAYVEWLSGATGRRYRLLTEAEWEYACRAGSTTRYSFDEDDRDLAAYAWFVGHLEGETRPVGDRRANDFGLFDMHGNVWEWCEDVWHDNYQDTPPVKGSAWLERGDQRIRVLRGGSWVSGPRGLRSAVRLEGATDYRHNNVGFRVARAPDP
ncbi:MAG: formylglycine-generating enzyme family protein [Proteobacteria bacterium]|nr:formylglycine-generating enzyme family protein [Pseudomonadota bacterium]MDA1323344.1 formylglycine-generating enzyme family protein [Pseudomonadota bacterium]